MRATLNITLTKKLTPAQLRVMAWLGKGWTACPGAGAIITVNGKRICNTDTMKSLERAGLVSVDSNRCWSATEHGRELVSLLAL